EGAGIRGMRERALLVGAELTVEPRAEGGTELRLAVPVPARFPAHVLVPVRPGRKSVPSTAPAVVRRSARAHAPPP
ncbi:sensor histidine kinase, partial [Actinospica acidiphila]|nr:sensor histidine kinase [Actinospica acidiphila]